LVKKLLISLLIAFPLGMAAQFPRFSLSTDVGLQRNFKKEQNYLVVGHNTVAHFHLADVHGVFFSFGYYHPGRFTNRPVARAKSPTTTPQAMAYINKGKMRVKEFSIGYRRYLRGNFEQNRKWNIYGSAAFGLMFGKVINTHNISIDTMQYALPVRSGEAKFKRLTLDLALGTEHAIGGDFYFYTEARAWIPTTDYPSKFLFVNDNAPFMGMLGVGFRLLF